MVDLLWQSGTIGGMTLPHRVVMGAMHLGLEDRDDGGRALAAFYTERVRGGAALVVTGGWAVSRAGAAGPHYGLLDEPGHRPTLRRVAADVHDAGGRVVLQLFHAGRYASRESFGLPPVAPSAIASRFSPVPPKALTLEEARATAEDFARGAEVAVASGFDGVELMGSEGYLLNQFVSPLTNDRDDEYGGNAERRMRFPLHVVRLVREAVGPDFPVVYRMSGADLVPGSTTPAETLRFARELAAAGVDALNVGIGWHESRVPTVQLTVPPVAWAAEAAAVKSAVGELPVIAGNRVNRLTQAEDLLRSGAADFVSMARAFLADPDVVAKGRESAGPVNICIACDQACIDRSLVDEPVSCLVNPRAAREVELGGVGVPSTTGRGRRYAVVGGGPAGLSAARALAQSGAAVELFEQADELGGQFRLARLVPGKADYDGTIRYYTSELDRLGITVRLGERPDASELAARNAFDGVVVATGVRPREIEVPGADLAHVMSYPEAFEAVRTGVTNGAIRQRVAIIGAGGIGVDLAHLLTRAPAGNELARFRAEYLTGTTHPDGEEPRSRAREVTLMRRSGRIGAGIGRSTRWVLLGELRRRDVAFRTEIRYVAIVPQGILLGDPDDPELVRADTVVVAAGQVPHDPLSSELAARGVRHLVVGGARDTHGLNAVRAFEEGLLAASVLVPGG